MGLCPYCNQELHLSDFFRKTTYEGFFQSRIRGEFLGESIEVDDLHKSEPRIICKMFVCPRCQKILGFSEWGSTITY